MRKVIFILFASFLLINCSSITDETLIQENIPEATLIGRWNLVGFENALLYEFTSTKRYTFYSTNGSFLSLKDLLAQNKNANIGLDWWYVGQKVSVDLNFGNISTLTPQFKCNNYVLNWLDDKGEIHSTYFREGYNYASCK